MKKILLFAVALFVSAASFAQESNLDASGNIQRGPYETNAFKDNWFVDFGGGIQWTTTNFKISDGVGWAGNINVGKWFTPEYGARIGARFGTSPWEADPNTPVLDVNGFQFWKADVLWNWSSFFKGYSDSRKFDFVPFVGFGLVLAYSSDTDNFLKGNKEFGFEAGVLLNYALGRNFALNLELSSQLNKEKAFAINPNHNSGRIPFIGFPTVTFGGIYKFERADWTRKSSTIAAYTAAVAAAEAAASQAQADAAAVKAVAATKQDQAQREVAQVKEELAVAQSQASDYGDLFEEPIIAYFQIGKSTLTVTEKEHVKYIAKNLISRGENITFTLSGNADSKTGSARRNKQLSKERADYVYKLMTEELGIDGSRFVVRANGGNDIFDTPELNRAVIIEKQ